MRPRRSLLPLFVVSGAVLLALADGPFTQRAASAASPPVPGPTTRIVTIHVPRAFRNTYVATLGSFTPAGDLWISARLPHHATSTLVEVDPRSGRTLVTVDLPVQLQGALTLGPDGNTWFAGSPKSKNNTASPDIGYVTAAGQVRTFSTTVPNGQIRHGGDGAMIYGLTAGPDGMVWFDIGDGLGNTWIGRVTRAGHVTLTRYSRYEMLWSFPLMYSPTGNLFLSGAQRILRISPRGGRPTSLGFGIAQTSDSAGDIFYWPTGGPDPALITPTGQRTVYPWLDGTRPPRSPDSGSITEAGDGDTWFAASDTYLVQRQGFPYHPVLGQITPGGRVTTWRSSFIAPDGGPVGDQFNDPDALEPGPDGRLWAVAYKAGTNGAWYLYAVTLPHVPVMRPARVRITHVRRTDHVVVVSLRCLSEPGLPCAGRIELTEGRRIVDSEPYAAEAGYPQVDALATSRADTGSHVVVTATDPEIGRTASVASSGRG